MNTFVNNDGLSKAVKNQIKENLTGGAAFNNHDVLSLWSFFRSLNYSLTSRLKHQLYGTIAVFPLTILIGTLCCLEFMREKGGVFTSWHQFQYGSVMLLSALVFVGAMVFVTCACDKLSPGKEWSEPPTGAWGRSVESLSHALTHAVRHWKKYTEAYAFRQVSLATRLVVRIYEERSDEVRLEILRALKEGEIVDTLRILKPVVERYLRELAGEIEAREIVLKKHLTLKSHGLDNRRHELEDLVQAANVCALTPHGQAQFFLRQALVRTSTRLELGLHPTDDPHHTEDFVI